MSEETNRVLLEAVKCLEYAKRKAARLKERVKRERELRERFWEIDLAKVEAEAFVELCSDSDSGQYRGLDGYSRIHKRLLDKDCGQQNRETEIKNEFFRSKPFVSVEELDNLQSTLRLLKLSNDKQNYEYQPLRGRVDSSLPRTEGVECLSTAGKVSRTDTIGRLRRRPHLGLGHWRQSVWGYLLLLPICSIVLRRCNLLRVLVAQSVVARSEPPLHRRTVVRRTTHRAASSDLGV